MTEDNYKLEFRTAQRRTTLTFINPKVSTDTIFINDNALEENLYLFEKYIEELLEHESIHLAILYAVGKSESRAYDKMYMFMDRVLVIMRSQNDKKQETQKI